MADNAAITRQILEAWDEVVGEKNGDDPEPEEPEAATTTYEEPDEEPDEEEPEQEPEPEEEEEPDEQEETEEEEPEEDEGDPEIMAFLSKYGGDKDAALKAGVEPQRVLGRQGTDLTAARQRVEELEQELAQTQALSGLGAFAPNDDQRDWIAEAVSSPQPAAYVDGAIRSGEFALARVLCQEWARDDPYQALRASQVVDQAEAQVYQAQQQQQQQVDGPIDLGILLNVMAQNFPAMRTYEAEMVKTIQRLGDEHPTVIEAKSGDLDRSMHALINLLEIAKSNATSVRSTKEKIKARQRQDGDSVREAAVVSSATTSPSRTETPRTRAIGPGLTLEDLEAEFAARKQ